MKILGFPWTIRTRLSLLYAGAFFVAGVALIFAIYLYLGVVLDRQFSIRLVNENATTAEGQLGAPGTLPPRELMDEAERISVLVRQARLNTLDTMLVVSLGLVGILTVAAGSIGWLVAGQALQPLREITATARRVADRSLHERIALSGPKDEIKDLADTLDQMLERLDRSFDSQRRFVANASHELRTPLTITRTLIEVALLDAQAADEKVKQLGTTLLAVNQRHEKLTDGLLTLASSEQRTAELHPVDLAEVVDKVVEDLSPIAGRVPVALETALAPAIVSGDAFLLERLIQNLIENAIQYNLPEDGWSASRPQRRKTTLSSFSRTPDPSCLPMKSRASSSRSAGWPRPSGSQGRPARPSCVARGSVFRSCVRSPMCMVVRSRPPRAKVAASWSE